MAAPENCFSPKVTSQTLQEPEKRHIFLIGVLNRLRWRQEPIECDAGPLRNKSNVDFLPGKRATVISKWFNQVISGVVLTLNMAGACFYSLALLILGIKETDYRMDF